MTTNTRPARPDTYVRTAKVEEIVHLRWQSLMKPFGIEMKDSYIDGDRQNGTLHVGSFILDADGHEVGKAACCATFVPSTFKLTEAWQLRDMATDAKFRNRDLGRSLMEFSENLLKDKERRSLLWCSARVAAVPFYERLGWEKHVSMPFDVTPFGRHQEMFKYLR